MPGTALAPLGYRLQVEQGLGGQLWVLNLSAGTHPWVGRRRGLAGAADLTLEKPQILHRAWKGRAGFSAV